jgi:hypothetical protein
MSFSYPNFCGPHRTGFNIQCPECIRETVDALPPMERALVSFWEDKPMSEIYRLLDGFRKMEIVS